MNLHDVFRVEAKVVTEVAAGIVLERILYEALERDATDVHFRLVDAKLQVDLRIGGRLFPFVSVYGQAGSVLRLVKARCRMDLSESRVAQDGSFHYVSETQVCDVRVACIPTISGESMVLRLLRVRAPDVSFAALGMTAFQCDQVMRMLEVQQGLILVVGPTGSGKTTTMYTMMMQLARSGRRVVSIEDPVESRIHECHQMEVRERNGISFESGLKAALRQDPDVLMVGEVRDSATASVVLKASMTGHLVLSTTHARDLVGAATRLVEFGLARGMLGEVLRGVIVQQWDRLKNGPCEVRGEWEPGTDCPRFDVWAVDDAMAELLSSNEAWSVVRRGFHLNRSCGDGFSDRRRW